MQSLHCPSIVLWNCFMALFHGTQLYVENLVVFFRGVLLSNRVAFVKLSR
jgi:hypothetical protein